MSTNAKEFLITLTLVVGFVVVANNFISCANQNFSGDNAIQLERVKHQAVMPQGHRR